jgi:TRAP-type C4-dicarboxylate transport system permease small subunit
MEEAALIALMGGMVFLSFLQIILRNFFATGLLWIEPMLRHMVLWVGLLGASLATREDKHLMIDLVSGHLAARTHHTLKILISLLCAGVCFYLIPPSLRFIQEEKLVGKSLLPWFPLWGSQLIIPFALGVMGMRFLTRAARSFKAISGGRDSS